MERRFPLAPMSTDIRVITFLVLPLPLFFLAVAPTVPHPNDRMLLGTAILVLVLYAMTWLLWRPSEFVLGASGLSIEFPLRRSLVAAGDIAGAEIVDRAAFRRDYGLGARVGVGGLWGAFGLLMTKNGTLAMYISRTDRFVLLKRRTGRSILLTPEQPEEFVRAVAPR